MKKEAWYLKNNSTIIRVDKIKEFTDIFVTNLESLNLQLKRNILEFQQAQLTGTKIKMKPLELIIKDEDFHNLWSKINEKLKSSSKSYEYLIFSTSSNPGDGRLVVMSESFDNMRNQKNKETVTEQIEDCAKID